MNYRNLYLLQKFKKNSPILLVLWFLLFPLLFSACGKDNFDSIYRYSIDGTIGKGLFEEFIEEFIEENHASNIPFYSKKDNQINDVKLIFDISIGLHAAYPVFEGSIAKNFQRNFTNIRYFECGHKDAHIADEYKESPALDYFRNGDTYSRRNNPRHSSLKSYLKGGLKEAVSDENAISVFFTDFLLDVNNGGFVARCLNNKAEHLIDNELHNGWGRDDFAQWFKQGGSVYVFYADFINPTWPGSDPTNYYAILFVPKNLNNTNANKLNRIINDNPNHVYFNPYGFYIDIGNFKANFSKMDSEVHPQIYMSNSEKGYLALGASFAGLENLDEPYLGEYEFVNISKFWSDPQISIKASNITTEIANHLNSSVLKPNSWQQGHQLISISNNITNPIINFNPGDISTQNYVAPDVFAWEYLFFLSDIENGILKSENLKNKLTSVVRTDISTTLDFNNEALFYSISGAIDDTKQSVLSALGNKPIFALYAFIGINK